MMSRWDEFWFKPADVAPLAAIRICTGLLLFYLYAAAAPERLDYLGHDAWIDADTIARLRASPTPAWWGHSIWFYATTSTVITITYTAFLLSIGCFTVGLFTRVATVFVWLGHVSFVHRAYLSWSGLDTILAMLLFYLCFAPSGLAFSLDRRRAHAHHRRPVEQHTWSANVIVRAIQVHMCVIYLAAGLSKLQGSQWWDGTAVWATMAMHEFALVDVTRLGHLGDTVCLIVSNIGVLFTLALEIGFSFLIWNPVMRPVVLTLAVVVHAGIGLLMGMTAFGMAMLTGCLAFVDGGAIRRIAARAFTLSE